MLSEDVKRRHLLPSPSVGDAVSALSIFRKNVGKDLSNIAMPISMNEPLNLLQKACEELQYCELLDKANHLENSVDRLMYITCFAISGYASSQYRAGRKACMVLRDQMQCFSPVLTVVFAALQPYDVRNVRVYPSG
jgi:hypothetical protein